MLTELLHRQVALLLRQVAMQRFGVVSVVYQFVGNLLGLFLRAAEDDGVNLGIVVHDTLQGEIFVLGVYHIVYVVHVFGSLVAASHHDFLGVVEIVLGYLLYLLAHGGREEQRVAVARLHAVEDFIYALRESHVQHLVCLVEHHVLHVVELRRTAVHQVDESSRSGNDNLGAVSERVYLVLYRRAAIHRHHVESVDIFAEVIQVVGNLQA